MCTSNFLGIKVISLYTDLSGIYQDFLSNSSDKLNTVTHFLPHRCHLAILSEAASLAGTLAKLWLPCSPLSRKERESRRARNCVHHLRSICVIPHRLLRCSAGQPY